MLDILRRSMTKLIYILKLFDILNNRRNIFRNGAGQIISGHLVLQLQTSGWNHRVHSFCSWSREGNSVCFCCCFFLTLKWCLSTEWTKLTEPRGRRSAFCTCRTSCSCQELVYHFSEFLVQVLRQWVTSPKSVLLLS